MALSATEVLERFRGCLLGLAVGDALGAKFEAQSAEAIKGRFPTLEALFAYPQEEIWYTGDTQMAIAIVGFLLITAGSFYFVWRFYPRGDKKEDKKDDKK